LPQIVSRDEVPDPHDLHVVQRVNGTVMQDGSTREPIFDVLTLVAFASTVMTLEPGDMILTGTPPGVGYFRDPPIALRPATASRLRSKASAPSRTRWSDDRDRGGAGSVVGDDRVVRGLLVGSSAAVVEPRSAKERFRS
jgi:hypothetical protein